MKKLFDAMVRKKCTFTLTFYKAFLIVKYLFPERNNKQTNKEHSFIKNI